MMLSMSFAEVAVLLSIVAVQGAPSDPPTQAELCDAYEIGAQQGKPAMQLSYGYCFLSGRGRPQDSERAQYWIEKSAKEGHPEALASLATIWVFEQKMAEKYEKSIQMLKLAVEKGWFPANFQLAMIHAHGFGVPADEDAAVDLFRKGAEKKHDASLATMALIDQFGLYGEEANQQKSRVWLCRLENVLKREGAQGLRDYLQEFLTDKKIRTFAIPPVDDARVELLLSELPKGRQFNYCQEVVQE